MNHDPVNELKAQARRLRHALAEQGVEVAHSKALELIARAHGDRCWEATQARVSALSSSSTSELSAEHAACSTDAATLQLRKQWLKWLQAALRMDDVAEEHLDELVHEVLPSEQASQVNNDGLHAQLEALHEWQLAKVADEAVARKETVRMLEYGLPVPCVRIAESSQPGYSPVIPARVSVCAGSVHEREVTVDCLEWFANHGAQDISKLICSKLRNSESSDQVALWLAENSVDSTLSKTLQELLTYMHWTHERVSRRDLVGVTVDINGAAVSAYLRHLMQQGIKFDAATLEALERQLF